MFGDEISPNHYSVSLVFNMVGGCLLIPALCLQKEGTLLHARKTRAGRDEQEDRGILPALRDVILLSVGEPGALEERRLGEAGYHIQ